jgi:hypothetical protein
MGILNEMEDIVEGMLLNEVSNEQIVNKFITNEFAKSKEEANKYGIKTDSFSPVWGSPSLKLVRVPTDMEELEIGWALNFNAIPIMFRDTNGALYFNKQKYSTSTSKVQTTIRGFLETNPEIKETVREVDGPTINKLVKGQEVDDSLLNKISDEEPENVETKVEEKPAEEVAASAPATEEQKVEEENKPVEAPKG